jgi:hypothetical protein
MCSDYNTQLISLNYIDPTDCKNDIYYNEYNSKNTTSWINFLTKNKPIINNIFFNIKNGTYELTIMWCLIITTIILLLSLLIKDANDELETERVL